MKELSVSIKEPCHEDWSLMTPVSQGKHCKSCQKTVVDFTKMSKSGVADYLSSNKESLCGRFSRDQLNVNLLPAKKNRRYAKYAALLIGLVPLTGISQTTSDQIERPFILGKRVMSSQTVNPKPPLTVKGTLVDKGSKTEILFGTAALYNSDGVLITGVETDVEGRFELTIGESQYIEFYYIGYDKRQYTFGEIERMKGAYIFELEEGVLTTGMIVIGDVEVSSLENVHSETMMKIDLEPVEIIEYGSSIDCTLTGLVSVVSDESKKDSWLIRMWKKFKQVTHTSYAAAKEHKRERKADQEEALDEEQQLTSETQGENHIDQPTMVIFPNPSAGLITVRLPLHHSNGRLQVVDASNQLVHSQLIETRQQQIDLTRLTAGTYVVSLIDDGRLIISEIFVKM